MPLVGIAFTRRNLFLAHAKVGQYAVAHQRPVRLLGKCMCPGAVLQFHVALGQGFPLLLEVVVKVLERDVVERLVGGKPGLDCNSVQSADQGVSLAVDRADGGDDGRRHRSLACDMVQATRRGVFLERRGDPVGRVAARQ